MNIFEMVEYLNRVRVRKRWTAPLYSDNIDIGILNLLYAQLDIGGISIEQARMSNKFPE